MKIVQIIFLLIFKIRKNEKAVEKCLFESLNPTDRVFKYSQDIQFLKKAIIDFNLLPRSLQIQFRQCEVSNDGLYLCEEKYGENNCEQCGMIYIQKCPAGYQRIDCGLCAQKCPLGTVEDALGALCAKPKVLKKKIYPSYLDCKKQGNKDCIDYGNFTTKQCPENFRSLGDFLCIFECPQGFIDNDIYCIPSYFETNLVFTSANENTIKINQLNLNYSKEIKTKQQRMIKIEIVIILITAILILLFLIFIEYITPGSIRIKKGMVIIFKTSIVLSISISNHIKQITRQDNVINTVAFKILFFYFLLFFLNNILLKYLLKNLTKGIISKILHTKLPIIIKRLPMTAAQLIQYLLINKKNIFQVLQRKGFQQNIKQPITPNIRYVENNTEKLLVNNYFVNQSFDTGRVFFTSIDISNLSSIVIKITIVSKNIEGLYQKYSISSKGSSDIYSIGIKIAIKKNINKYIARQTVQQFNMYNPLSSFILEAFRFINNIIRADKIIQFLSSNKDVVIQ